MQRSVSALVIDDDADTRDMLSALVTKAGYSIATACDGREALELLKLVRPRVIFVDLQMPIMNGAEFRQVQRRDRDLLAIPTVVMTGSREETMLDLAIEETLHKPVRAAELLAIVRRHSDPR